MASKACVALSMLVHARVVLAILDMASWQPDIGILVVSNTTPAPASQVGVALSRLELRLLTGG